MIKCPKCGSEHTIVITEVKSEKDKSSLLTFITVISGFILVIVGFLFLTMLSNNTEAIIYLLDGKADIAETLDISASLLSSILAIRAMWKVVKFFFITIVITAIIQKLMPYKTYSVHKRICNECNNQWYLPDQNNNQNGNQTPS